MKDIEAQLRHEIESSGLSPYQISKATGITNSQLSMFLNKKRSLNLTSVAKIANLLGIEFKKTNKQEKIIMAGRKKPEAEKVLYRISLRLSKLRNKGTLPDEDYHFLWEWTHELYRLALENE